MISAFYKRNKKGFTLIELMIVIAIIGILAAIAIPQFSAYKKRGYNTSAKADAKNAYTSAQAYYGDNPQGVLAASGDIAPFGYMSGNGITLAVTGAQNALQITSSHSSGDITYTVSASGQITP